MKKEELAEVTVSKQIAQERKAQEETKGRSLGGKK